MRNIVLLFLFITYSFAIVSIEPKDIGEKNPGISGEIGASLEINRGNTDTTSTSLSASLQIDKDHCLCFATLSYEYGESSGEKNKDRAFLHLRHLEKINEDNVWEFFAQLQKDEFKDQKLRALIGTGERYRFFNENETKTYIGIGAFLEREKIEDEDTKDYFRGNFYISFKKRFNDNVKMAFISYYQPKLDEFSDYESTNSLEFSVKLSKNLDLLILTNYDYDSRPPKDIKKYDLSQKIGISYKF
ncbi:DUF481 domain-containing protein [Nitrosophilus kaiyonis]|uniref:DUF481 domain-containing protein n=1 Tax=Nitrosophilus kaiyonis TaxID=2930200 RepID=UPI0024918FEB|nr:DUF481 domain-containing protein [Nitrosophilus kaiyonis]